MRRANCRDAEWLGLGWRASGGRFPPNADPRRKGSLWWGLRTEWGIPPQSLAPGALDTQAPVWFHLATGWPGGSSVAIPGHFTNDSGEARLGGRFAPTSRGASAEAGRRRCDGPRGVALHGLEERAAVDRVRQKAVAPQCEKAPPGALRGVGRVRSERH